MLPPEEESKLSAADWLQRLRNGGDYEHDEEQLAICLDKEKRTLADIGSSKEELMQLFIRERRNSAVNRLKLLRDGGYNYAYYHDKMLKDLEDAGLTLADIGTSDDELFQLLVIWKIKIAKDCIKVIRMGGDLGFQTAKMKKELAEIGLTLEDIGTSEEYLVKIAKDSFKELAQSILKTLRQSKINREYNGIQMRTHLANASMALADIGTTEQEVLKLSARDRE